MEKPGKPVEQDVPLSGGQVMYPTPPKEVDSPYEICVSSAYPITDIDPHQIVRAIAATLAAHRQASGQLSVALVDDATMTDLHNRFMGISEPTDVLTFDLRDADFNHEERGESEAVDGEIVISMDTAKRESAQRGRPVADEVLLYAIHGTLHLLGYDDHSDADFQKMHAREDELLTDLGVGPVYGARPR